MNFSDYVLYGICPQYDNCSFTRCNECNMILKFSHLAEHIAKKHELKKICINKKPSSSSSSSISPVRSQSQSQQREPKNVDIENCQPSKPAKSERKPQAQTQQLKKKEKVQKNTKLMKKSVSLPVAPVFAAQAAAVSLPKPSRKASKAEIVIEPKPQDEIVANGFDATQTENPPSTDDTVACYLADGNYLNDDKSFINDLEKCLLDAISIHDEDDDCRGVDGGVAHDTESINSNQDNESGLPLCSGLLTEAATKKTNNTNDVNDQYSVNSNTNSINTHKNSNKTKSYDPDKHCGVPCSITANNNDLKPCMRSLTCKKHSINLRRQVTGRTKPFNELIKELKLKKQQQQQQPSSTDTTTAPTTPDDDDDDVNMSNIIIQSESTEPTMMLPADTLAELSIRRHDDLIPYSICTFNSRLINNSFQVFNYKQDLFRSLFTKSVNEYLACNSRHKKKNTGRLEETVDEDVIEIENGDEEEVEEEICFINSTLANCKQPASQVKKYEPLTPCTPIHHIGEVLQPQQQQQHQMNGTNSFIPSPSTFSSSSSSSSASTTSSSSLSTPLTSSQKRYNIDSYLNYLNTNGGGGATGGNVAPMSTLTTQTSSQGCSSSASKYMKLHNGTSVMSNGVGTATATTVTPATAIKMPIKVKTK